MADKLETSPEQAARDALLAVVRTWLHPATSDVGYAVKNMIERLDRMGFAVVPKGPFNG